MLRYKDTKIQRYSDTQIASYSDPQILESRRGVRKQRTEGVTCTLLMSTNWAQVAFFFSAHYPRSGGKGSIGVEIKAGRPIIKTSENQASTVAQETANERISRETCVAGFQKWLAACFAFTNPRPSGMETRMPSRGIPYYTILSGTTRVVHHHHGARAPLEQIAYLISPGPVRSKVRTSRRCSDTKIQRYKDTRIPR